MKVVYQPPMNVMRERYRRKISDLKDLGTVYTKVSIFLDRWVQKNFRSEGGEVGGWKPLEAGGRYVGRGSSRRFDTSARILQDTGRLKASFLPFATKKNAGIGSDLPYAKAHEDGNGVPKRRTLPEHNEVMPKVKKIIDAHIKKSLKDDKL